MMIIAMRSNSESIECIRGGFETTQSRDDVGLYDRVTWLSDVCHS